MTGLLAWPHQIVYAPYSSCRLRFQSCLPSKSYAARSPLPKWTTTVLPSVTGEGLARLCSWWNFCVRPFGRFADRLAAADFLRPDDLAR